MIPRVLLVAFAVACASCAASGCAPTVVAPIVEVVPARAGTSNAELIAAARKALAGCDIEGAAATLSTAAGMGDADALGLLSEVRARQGRLSEAVESARRSTVLRPDDDTLFARLAILVLRSDPDVAGALIGERLSRHPDSPVVSVLHAEALSANGSHEQARSTLAALERSHPGFRAARAAAARIAMREGHFGDALELAGGLVSGTDDAALEATLVRVSALAQTGDLPGATEVARSAVAKWPDHAPASAQLGGLLVKAPGQVTAAVAVLEKAARCDRSNVASRTNLGEALRRLGRNDEAIAVLETAVALGPTAPDAHFNLGLACLYGRANAAHPVERAECAVRSFERYVALAGKGAVEDADVLLQLANRFLGMEKWRAENVK